jgi:hypothetical protein
MGASKKARRPQRSHYQATTSARASASAIAQHAELMPEEEADRGVEEHATRPIAAITPPPAEAAPAASTSEPADPPTIILTPEQIALLSHARPPHVTLPSPDEEGYDFLAQDPRRDSERATIILDVNALLAAPPPPEDDFVPVARVEVPPPPPPLKGRDLKTPSSVPIIAEEHSATPTRKRSETSDRDEELARLRRQRLEREAGIAERAPDEPYISDKLQQWWRDIQPGIARVLGRAHRAGTRGARATSYQTSSQLPVVKVRSMDEEEAPVLQRLSETAKTIGKRAQTAAHPALDKLHSRAEQVAQQIVDRIDEKLGGRPPLQHVLLGPGRMIVSFAPNVTIRDAQTIIAAIQARSLRRLVGYNAYLVLVPPGREARYAERLHAYHQVTGVHFGPQRPSQLPTTRAATV